MPMNKKLLLINPVNSRRAGLAINKNSRFPPLGLGIVATLTPPGWDVEIIDENFEPFQYREADLVGISAFTAAVNRAYEIATIYRDKGIPTVLGGIHASMCTDEALQHVDSVVTGEAENIWAKVIADFKAGKLQQVYHGELAELREMPKPRHDLFHKGYRFGSIQTARGCPMDCEFCSVTVFNGHRYRQRPVDEVLDELESIPQNMVFFVDDNIIGYGKQAEERALSLFKGIIDRGIKKQWFCQASMNFADNEDVLKYAAKSGCRIVFLGVESESADSLQEVNKKLNLKIAADNYERVFRRINKAGIAVLGAFIYGMDNDNPEALQHRTDYILSSSIDVMQTTFLTPLPGTRVFDKLKNEGRLLYHDFPTDWDRYDMTEVVHHPLNMEPAVFNEIYRNNVGRLLSSSNIRHKFFNTWKNTGSLFTAMWAYSSNMNYRNVFLATGNRD